MAYILHREEHSHPCGAFMPFQNCKTLCEVCVILREKPAIGLLTKQAHDQVLAMVDCFTKGPRETPFPVPVLYVVPST